MCQQENQEDLGLWEEKFGKFVDVKVNGKIEIDVGLQQIFPKWLNLSLKLLAPKQVTSVNRNLRYGSLIPQQCIATEK